MGIKFPCFKQISTLFNISEVMEEIRKVGSVNENSNNKNSFYVNEKSRQCNFF